MGGVTDALVAIGDEAASGRDYHARLEDLRARHHEAAAGLLSADEAAEVATGIDRVLDELDRLLHGVSLVGECSPRTGDTVLSCGERLSARLLAASAVRPAALRPSSATHVV